jgi:hypothetical protein
MKKVIETFARFYNLETAYAGTTRIMYIRGTRVSEFLAAVRSRYPGLAFELKDGNSVSNFEDIKKAEPSSAPTVGIAQNTIEQSKKTQEQIEPKNVVDLAESVTQEKKKPTPQEVDEYLLSNPVDRKTKGPYDKAAAHFGVKTDYIRGRWARLREQGLVEKSIKIEKE